MLDVAHGIHDPVGSTPPRRRPSIRRTSATDILRPDGPDGDVLLRGTLRDLMTHEDGTAAVVTEARLEVDVAYWDERRITRIDATPCIPGLDSLLGRHAAGGFRGPAHALLPAGDPITASALGHLLDDVPVTVLISGYEIRRADAARTGAQREIRLRPWAPDACAGYRTDGTAARHRAASGSPPVPTGPNAPRLETTDDPLAWPALAPLTPADMRRRRRMDVYVDGDELFVDAMFRDTHMADAGAETVVHEYELAATIDAGTRRLTAVRARDRVLPWTECSAAAASAPRVVGVALAELGEVVRSTFTGPSTCTHLNDMLRALADVDGLATRLGPKALSPK